MATIKNTQMMKYTLTKKPKNPIIIQGFPSMGLVGTIVAKFLIDHLDVEEIGFIESEQLLPLTAIHKSKVIKPITLFYNKKYNLVLIQSIAEVAGLEWELADTLISISKDLNAKEIIVVESMPTHEEQISLYYYSSKGKLNLPLLKEGIIMGTTAAMLLKAKGQLPITCIFAEAHSNLPDSESAAKVVEALDNYLKLRIDYKPLLEAARKFEKNLKHFMEKSRDATMIKEKKETSYIG